MPRFLLVFRHRDGARNELRDKTDGVPRVNGSELADGAIFELKGVRWFATREDAEDGLVRFVCRPGEPADS